MNNKVWYFTFCGDSPLRHYYVKLNGDYGQAREKMFSMFGEKWAFQYDEDEFIPQIDIYNLKELKLNLED